MSFIDEFVDFVKVRIPAHPDWIENCGLSMLATVCNGITIETMYGPLIPNHWAMVIGPSGIGNKSVILKYYVFPSIRRLNQLSKCDHHFPTSFSTESFTEFLIKTSNVGIVISDEFASFLKGAHKKAYLADASEFLSSAYAGHVPKRVTKVSGIEDVPYVHMNVLACTTPYFYKIIRENPIFIQGFGNRFLYTIFEVDSPPDIKNFFDRNLWQERKDEVEKIAQALARIKKLKIDDLVPDDEAEGMFLEYKEEKMGKAIKRYKKDKLDLGYPYIDRMPEKTLKMSGLYAISRIWNELEYYLSTEDERRMLIIEAEDMKRSIEKSNYGLMQFKKLLDERYLWVTEEKSAESVQHLIMVLCDAIKEFGGEVARKALSYKLRWKKRELDEVIETAMDQGLIETFETRGSKNRPTTNYKLS